MAQHPRASRGETVLDVRSEAAALFEGIHKLVPKIHLCDWLLSCFHLVVRAPWSHECLRGDHASRQNQARPCQTAFLLALCEHPALKQCNARCDNQSKDAQPWDRLSASGVGLVNQAASAPDPLYHPDSAVWPARRHPVSYNTFP